MSHGQAVHDERGALTFQEQNVPSKYISQICQHMQGLPALMPSQTVRWQNQDCALGVTAPESLSAFPWDPEEELEVQEALRGAATVLGSRAMCAHPGNCKSSCKSG